MEQIEESKKQRLTGKLRQSIAWAAATEIGFAAVVVLFFVYQKEFWWILLIAFGIYTLLFIYIITALRRGILREVISFASDYSGTQNTLLFKMNIPYGIVDKKGNVLWMNRRMQNMAAISQIGGILLMILAILL